MTPAVRTRLQPSAPAGRPPLGDTFPVRWEHGSIVLVVLLVALGALVLVVGLTLSFRSNAIVAEAESTGRDDLAAADRALAEVAARAWAEWDPAQYRLEDEWEGALLEVPGEAAGLMTARVAPPGAAEGAAGTGPWGFSVDALVEIGRDGLDLPRAALLADRLVASAGRTTRAVEPDTVGEAPMWLCVADVPAPGLLPPGVSPALLEERWHLDAGSIALAKDAASRAGSPVVTLAGRTAGTYRPPRAMPGDSSENPVLLVATGGADLDLSGLGDLYGVVVVDGAGVLLEDTRLHGGLMVTETADVGARGEVVWSSPMHRWATERSVRRVRLVPHSRVEAVRP